MKTVNRQISNVSIRFYSRIASTSEKLSGAFLLAVGVFLITFGLASLSAAQETFHQPDFNDQFIREAVGLIFRLVEGAFGALIMTVAGIAALISAAMGAYRLALGMVVVAVGAFILRSLVSLFFGVDFPVRE